MNSEPSDPILYDVAAGVATITLNMPDRKNSLSDELVAAFSGLLTRAVEDNAVRVIMVTNEGNTFCAGADLKADRPGVSEDETERRPGDTAKPTLVDILQQIMDAPKPVIGRIDGHATGGGVGLVAACDISVMRDDAKLGFTEVRIGVAPAIISVVCLPKLRRADASELFLTGARVTPSRAAEVGLINQAVAADQLDDAVAAIVDQLVRGGPLALATAKELIRQVPTMARDDAFAWTAVRSRQLFDSDEATAGIAAFRNREPAPWVPAD